MWNLVSLLSDKYDIITLVKDKFRSHKTACLLTVKLVGLGELGFSLIDSGQLN